MPGYGESRLLDIIFWQKRTIIKWIQNILLRLTLMIFKCIVMKETSLLIISEQTCLDAISSQVGLLWAKRLAWNVSTGSLVCSDAAILCTRLHQCTTVTSKCMSIKQNFTQWPILGLQHFILFSLAPHTLQHSKPQIWGRHHELWSTWPLTSFLIASLTPSSSSYYGCHKPRDRHQLSQLVFSFSQMIIFRVQQLQGNIH